ncbi:hypothetical protein SARC_14210 [Sphaeroforma arctica JP610]|uniref:rRNA methyltransferase 2, mitochondrial n=1 Tax=Sphaeroforma arctica JP610 TaxID=667725 RepID=A0A0L0F9L8_9EUKA|nr:hypothetical protein SARC_14210 [Sphaeroforma arctica JP610]KNC73231.1 hypothetical protein SARC_14210 [Sphaeroforma arctica JP610]|eukprot:XP_014147133.1 hypothetical protein SARC_14210 [Sphaeroforma arctica JP610]
MTRPIGISHCTCSGLWRSGSVPYYPKTSFGGVCGANRLRTPLHCPPLLERSFLHQDYSTSRKVTKRSTSTNTKAKVNTINSSKSTGKGSTGCSKQGNNVTSKGKRPTGSSAQWIKRQLADPWAKLAADSHYASRSAFKLQQIDDKHRFLKPGRTVIDCGARPGGWSQVSVERCCRPPKNRSVKNFVPGVVISVDICGMGLIFRGV